MKSIQRVFLGFALAFAFIGVEAITSVQIFNTDTKNSLFELYKATQGPLWEKNAGWLAEDNYCDWYGVNCGNNEVFRLCLTRIIWPTTRSSALSKNGRDESPL
jgi:hypothetical protein